MGYLKQMRAGATVWRSFSDSQLIHECICITKWVADSAKWMDKGLIMAQGHIELNEDIHSSWTFARIMNIPNLKAFITNGNHHEWAMNK